MVRLNWSNDLEIGVAAMDAEHKQLVEAMNRIEDLAARKAGKQPIDSAIQHLIALTQKHFADEEAHMAKTGYADLRRHKMIHEDLLAKVAGHHQTFRKGDGTLPDAFLQFLVYWLTSHIKGIDRKYVPQPAGKR